MIGKTYFPIETLSLFRVDMLCFCWGGKHHHPQGETVGCFTFFLSQQQIKQKFHHYHSQHVGPVIRTIGTFFPRKAEKRDAWQMGAPCQQRRDRPLKRRFTAVSLAVLCNILMNDKSTNLPTDPDRTFLRNKGLYGLLTGSHRLRVRSICVFQKPKLSPLPICARWGGFDKKTCQLPWRGTKSSKCGKSRDGTKEEWLDRRSKVPPWVQWRGWWASMKLTNQNHPTS